MASLLLAGALWGCGDSAAKAPPPKPATQSTSPAEAAPTTIAVRPQVPAHSEAQLGEALSGYGSRFKPPLRPSYQHYSPGCKTLVDPAFTGDCIIASSPAGTVAGIVEVESGVTSGVRQERDLVWRREGRRWALAEVHVASVCLNGLVCTSSPGLPAKLWRDDVARGNGEDLVFVLPSDRAGFGSELDIVSGDGKVVLYRYLGQGFAVVPAGGGLVTYVPGASEANPADAVFDELLIDFEDGAWRLISDQYVPYAAAMERHKGAFYDPEAVAAAASG